MRRVLAAVRAKPVFFWPLWIASAALPLLTLAVVALLSWQRGRDVAVAQLRADLGLLHQHALRAFDSQHALLAALQWQTRDMSWEEIGASAGLAALMQELAAQAAGTSNVGIVRPDGRLAQITAMPFPPPPTDFSDRDYVRHQQGPEAGPYLSAPLIGRLSGRAAINYSRPRLDRSGRPDGGLFWTTFRQDDFNAVYATLLAGTRDEIALLRAPDGTILASHPPPPPPPREGQSPPGNGSGMEGAARAALAAPGGTVLRRGPSPLDGQTRLYAARALEDIPAVVVKGLHPAGVWAAFRGELAGLAALAAAAGLTLLWLTWRAHAAAARETKALAAGRAEAERRAEAEAALRQSQRLQLLGEVVAGVAHDFRNTIQAVQGGVTLARKAIEGGDGARALRLLAMTGAAAGRGSQLIERMMHAARRDRRAAAGDATIDPAAALRAAAELLGRTLPAGHKVVVEIRPEGLPGRVAGEMAEFEAALLNLTVNARDAMPQGGTIHISLEGDGGPGGARPAEPPGERRHARIAVRDSGIGMDAATLARIAEPFFTTKPPGKGTGLGLTSVRAFAQAAGGTLGVHSAGPGQGTTVTIWLPEARAAVPPLTPGAGAAS